MRWPLLARSFVVALSVAGCATLAGIVDAEDVGAGTDGGEAEAAPSAIEAGTGADSAACVAKSTPQPDGVVHARRTSSPPVIDGNFTDWACVDRIAVGEGAASKGLPASGVPTVEVAFLWTATDIFFYAHAVTARPGLENNGTQVFRNDSVHLFIGQEGPFGQDGKYRPGDHQLTIDHAGRVGDYVNGVMSSAKIDAKVNTINGGTGPIDFQIEARIDAASLGLTSALTSGKSLVVNVMVVDAKDSSVGFRVWRLPPIGVCPCVGTCCQRIGTQNSPTCDMRCTETLQLD